MTTKTSPQRERFEDWDELRFVRNSRTGTVHVVVPAKQVDENRDASLVDMAEEERAEIMLGLTLGLTSTLCGFVARINDRLVDADRPISAFPDEALCTSCYRVLGPMAHRAFEHPTSDEEA